MISLDLTSKHYGDVPALGQIELSLTSGDVAAIVGASGVGKTTLLRILAGLDDRFDGRIERKGQLAMVFQEPTVLPWRSVLQNLSLFHPDLPHGDLADMLARVGLQDHAGKFPGQLSLGQQRRLSLARAFLGQPEVLILDEPFASLDRGLREEMMQLTETLLSETRPATLLVTHDHSEARRLASQIWTLSGSPARLTREG